MIVTLMIRIVADLVFESAAAQRRAFEQEMKRYLEQNGVPAPSREQTAAR